MKLPKRKKNRIDNYDYSENGAYFITICTKDRKKILSDIVGDGACDIPKTVLSNYGKTVEKYIIIMDSKYENISIDKYIVMPDHIHLLIRITRNKSGTSQAPSPTNAIIPKFVSLYKRYCNKEIGHNIFQRSYYDHIIRDEKDYVKTINYIETNPQKWFLSNNKD